jgi:hypothetical protein
MLHVSVLTPLVYMSMAHKLHLLLQYSWPVAQETSPAAMRAKVAQAQTTSLLVVVLVQPTAVVVTISLPEDVQVAATP